MPLKSYFLECHLWREQALSAARIFRELAANRGWNEVIPREADLLVGIGGDGTFLRTARLAALYNKPFWTLGMGRINFLPNVVEDITSAIEELLDGNVREDRIPAYKYSYDGMSENKSMFFINDLLITKAGHSSTLTLSVFSNGDEVFRMFGDGVVISTSLGSTGYNISAGGPVLDRRLLAFSITPLNAHQTNLRSLVVPTDAVLEVQVTEAFRGALLIADGVDVKQLPLDKVVRVTNEVLQLRHLVNRRAVGFYEKMDNKFNWRRL